MSEKRKRIDLDVVRDAILAERELVKEQEIANAEKIASRVLKCIAEERFSVHDEKIRVSFRIWRRNIWKYDYDTVKAILQANGLQLDLEDDVYPHAGIRADMSFVFPLTDFEVVVVLVDLEAA